MPPKTYAQMVEQNQRALAQAQLADPDSHFPYKHDVVTEMVRQPGLPMGPGLPEDQGRAAVGGADDETRTIEDYMSQGIADATRDYVAAQAAYFEDGGGETYDKYSAARDRLQAARLDHRENRGNAIVIGAAARRAG